MGLIAQEEHKSVMEAISVAQHRLASLEAQIKQAETTHSRWVAILSQIKVDASEAAIDCERNRTKARELSERLQQAQAVLDEISAI